MRYASEKRCPCSSSVVLLKATHLHGFFSAKQEPESCASCPLHLLHNPHLYFLLRPHKQAPNSLLFPPGLMSGLIPECRSQHRLQQYSRCSESPQTSPLENDAIADRLLCGHLKLWPCLTAFVCCVCEALLWSEPTLTSKTSHFPRK